MKQCRFVSDIESNTDCDQSKKRKTFINTKYLSSSDDSEEESTIQSRNTAKKQLPTQDNDIPLIPVLPALPSSLSPLSTTRSTPTRSEKSSSSSNLF